MDPCPGSIRQVQTVVISGMSGSGKSTVLKAFEDLEYFCVDNLPIVLLPEFLSFTEGTASKPTKVALVMDVREPTFLDQYYSIFTQIKDDGYHLEILFLDADEDILVRRFSQTRRPHPLQPKGNVVDGIRIERTRLACLKECSDRVVDTSELNVHQLRQQIFSLYAPRERLDRMVFHVLSFGFKYGVPADANMVLDVRFLPNPYFVQQIRHLDGSSGEIRGYVLAQAETGEFLDRLEGFLSYLAPKYESEGKSYFVIAVGCTGGRHRSVVISEQVREMLERKGSDVILTHRDIEKES